MSLSPERDPVGPAIDWGAVHARLARLDAALHEALAPSPEQVQARLEDRARVLARVPPRPLGLAEQIEVVAFTVEGENFAVETRFVRRVFKPETMTPVPGTPGVLRGVVNLRGEILAVFDLLPLFGTDRSGRAGGETVGPYVMVLGDGRDELGIVADALHEVRPLGLDDLSEPTTTLEPLGRHLIRGLTSDALAVLDGAALLRDDRLFIDQGDDPGA